ncbi:MAG: ribosome silencing factor [Desulfobacteraceae bacterium]|nr:ribosome silencing factor [Desulfobacteraceae bacterium]
MTKKESLDQFLEPIFSRKPASVTALDVHNLTSYTDNIIIVTGTSTRQTKSIAEHICMDLKEQGQKPLGVEGMKQGNWVLIDFGWVIIHVFDNETNDLYDLKGLWADAPNIDLSKFE